MILMGDLKYKFSFKKFNRMITLEKKVNDELERL